MVDAGDAGRWCDLLHATRVLEQDTEPPKQQSERALARIHAHDVLRRQRPAVI